LPTAWNVAATASSGCCAALRRPTGGNRRTRTSPSCSPTDSWTRPRTEAWCGRRGRRRAGRSVGALELRLQVHERDETPILRRRNPSPIPFQ
jgi:hypothetical protein